MIECRVAEPDPWCRSCGVEGAPRDAVTRTLAHELFGHRPTTLLIRVRRYRSERCGRTWWHDTTKAARAQAMISRRGLNRALGPIVIDYLTISRTTAGLVLSWHTANTANLAEGKRQLIGNPHRFDGVTTIGVDEDVWRHTRSPTYCRPTRSVRRLTKYLARRAVKHQAGAESSSIPLFVDGGESGRLYFGANGIEPLEVHDQGLPSVRVDSTRALMSQY